MNEQFPQAPIDDVQRHDDNPEYLEHHPNAEQNPDRALDMAYASKIHEELATEAANAAIEAGTGTYQGPSGKLNNIQGKTGDELLDVASIFREAADRGADAAGRTYDRRKLQEEESKLREQKAQAIKQGKAGTSRL